MTKWAIKSDAGFVLGPNRTDDAIEIFEGKDDALSVLGWVQNYQQEEHPNPRVVRVEVTVREI